MSTSETKQPNLISPPPSEQKKKKQRSPSYPYLNLEESLKFAKTLWEKEKRHPASIPVVVQHWNYGAKSSAGLLSIAALKKFGLLIEEGSGTQRTVRLSDFALEIIKHEDSPDERAKLLKIAALKPDIHRELWESHREASDSNIRRYLVFDRKFNETAADALIEEFKDTITFAKLSAEDIVEDSSTPDESESEDDSHEQEDESLAPSGKKQLPSPQKNMIDIPVPLPSGVTAYFRVPTSMSAADFTVFRTVLGAYKQALVKGTEVNAAKFPAKAIWRNKDSDKPVTIVGEMGKTKDDETFFQTDDGSGIPGSQLDFDATLPED